MTLGQPGQPAPPYQRGDVSGDVPRSGRDANIAADALQRWNLAAAQRGAYGCQLLQRLFIIRFGGGGAGEAAAAEAGGTGMGRGGGGTEGAVSDTIVASPATRG
jgi:hypothetical protein